MTHQMTLRRKYPTGAQEWVCPECDRRFLLQPEPYKKIVMVAGDEFAMHSGNKSKVVNGASIRDDLGALFDIWNEDE